MTRINVGIKPKYLSDEHLLAEHREIKRIPNMLYKGVLNNKNFKIPENFSLGNGHVLFFINKQLYLYMRYISIYNECINRGFNVTNYSNAFENIKQYDKYWNNYFPTETDKKLLIDRISNNIDKSTKEYFHYNKQKYNKEFFKNLINI